MKKIESAKRLNEMIRLYKDEGLTMVQIARKLNLSKQAVHDRLKRAGVQSRRFRQPPRVIERETLMQLYINEQLAVHKIAKILRSDPRTVARELDRHSIDRRPGRIRPSELNVLQVGESVLITYRTDRVPYVNYYLMAKVRKIRVSVRRAGVGRVQITRIE